MKKKDEIVVLYKKCTDCKQEKRATKENFAKNKNTPDGLQSICKLCQKKRRDTKEVLEARTKRKAESLKKIKIKKEKTEKWKEDNSVDNPNKYKYKVGEILIKKLEVIEHLIILEGDKHQQKRRAYKVKCLECGDIQTKTESNLNKSIKRNKCGCLVCAGQKVVYGINSILDTDYWMLELGVDAEQAKYLKSTSRKLIDIVCPDCGRKFTKKVENIYLARSICCSCGDIGRSYPERVVAGVLNQVGVKYDIEFSPEWIGNKRYDFYLRELNTIIEVHGMQHYKEVTFNKLSLREEQENDRFKYETAIKNKVTNYIIIDARKSELEFIKNNIITTLGTVVDLERIDWKEVENFATKNFVKEVCNHYKTTKMPISELSIFFKTSQSAITQYLHRGTKLGWCNYEPERGSEKESVIIIEGNVFKFKSRREAVNYIKEKYSIGISGGWFTRGVPKKHRERVTFIGDLTDYNNKYQYKKIA